MLLINTKNESQIIHSLLVTKLHNIVYSSLYIKKFFSIQSNAFETIHYFIFSCFIFRTYPHRVHPKVEGGEYIQGLGVIPRMITYIPSDKITQSVLDNLQNGDLVGVY
ncbi:hypothetical protein B2J67_06990, partial [Vibrio cholerae]